MYAQTSIFRTLSISGFLVGITLSAACGPVPALGPPDPAVSVADMMAPADMRPAPAPDMTPPPPPDAGWRCVPGLGTPVRIANGDVQCAAADGLNCMHELCNGHPIGPIDVPNATDPLSCGADHQAKYGATGYDQTDHWCYLGCQALGCDRVKPVNVGWRCVAGVGTAVRLSGGDVQCAAADGLNCMHNLCGGHAPGPIDVPNAVNPLSCGADHQLKYGVTGYDETDHWCYVGGVALGCGKTQPVSGKVMSLSCSSGGNANGCVAGIASGNTVWYAHWSATIVRESIPANMGYVNVTAASCSSGANTCVGNLAFGDGRWTSEFPVSINRSAPGANQGYVNVRALKCAVVVGMYNCIAQLDLDGGAWVAKWTSPIKHQ